jgi:hypothetical protein
MVKNSLYVALCNIAGAEIHKPLTEELDPNQFMQIHRGM